MDIERLEWNAAGELAAQRLRDRGLHKYSSEQYAAEFKTVVRELEQSKARRRGEVAAHIRATQDAGVRSYAKAQAAVCSDLKLFADSGVTARHRLAAVLSAMKLPDGKIDTKAALELLRLMPTDVQAAANVRLDELAHESLNNRGVQLTDRVLQEAMSEVLRESPALARAVNSGAVSRELLNILFWPVAHAFA
jgi:hypothetical protein